MFKSWLDMRALGRFLEQECADFDPGPGGRRSVLERTFMVLIGREAKIEKMQREIDRLRTDRPSYVGTGAKDYRGPFRASANVKPEPKVEAPNARSVIRDHPPVRDDDPVHHEDEPSVGDPYQGDDSAPPSKSA